MDYLNSFFQNIKDKLSNPFFGTLIFILIIHHWELWYTLFNFDKNYTRNAKVSLIRNLAEHELSTKNILNDILYALLISLCGYLIVVGTRTLSMLIEFRIMPIITGKIIDKNVVLKSIHDETVSERDEYAEKYEEQRKNVRILSKNYDEQTEQIKQKDQDLLKQSETISNTIRELDNIKKKLENSQSENNIKKTQISQLNNSLEELKKDLDINLEIKEKYEHLFFNQDNTLFYTSSKKFPPEVTDKVFQLKKENKWKTFLEVGTFFTQGGTMSGIALTDMIEKGLAFERDKKDEFTPLGKIIWRYRKVFENEGDETETIPF